MQPPNFVKKPIRAVFRKMVRLSVALHRRHYRYIFILSHMRSGSTLLSHILASHEDFVGAGETHVNYRSPADLPRLVLRTCELLHKLQLDGTHIVDQINHPYVTDEVLLSSLIYKCVILIRSPESSLKSLSALFGWQESTVLETYVGRLAQISHYGQVLRGRAIVVEYDDLVDRTEETLAALSRFLDVDPPFTANYMTHKATGKMGDPSKNISSGRILRTQGHEATLGAEIMSEASLAHRKCRHELLSAGVPFACSSLLEATDSQPKRRQGGDMPRISR